MTKKITFLIIGIFFALANINGSKDSNQLDHCASYISFPFISDGQQYKVLLSGDEIAEFHTTLYGGTIYRVAGCNVARENSLIFTLKDRNGNVLFSNKEHNNAEYWDFKINSSMDCIIEARLDNKKSETGLVFLHIGFKNI